MRTLIPVSVDADMTRDFECDGYVTLPDVLSPALLSELREAFAAPLDGGSGRVRNVLSTHDAARNAATSDAVHAVLHAFRGGHRFVPVRGNLFDKTAAPFTVFHNP